MSQDKKKSEDQKKKTEELELGRRDFLTTLAVMGGGAIAYASPSLAAAGANAAGASSAANPGKFNVELPARYKIDEPDVKINVVKNDGKTETIAFRASGQLTLHPTTNPNIASVHADAFDFIGVEDPGTTAKIESGTILGQLNLESGEFVENRYGLGISTTEGAASATVVPVLAQIEEGTVSQKKCTKRNDVELDVDPSQLLQGANGSGLAFGLEPVGGGGTV